MTENDDVGCIWLVVVQTERGTVIVSHGYRDSGERVVLPPDDPRDMGARFDRERGEWFLPPVRKP